MIGSHELVAIATTTLDPFTCEEIKIARNLADGLYAVYSTELLTGA